MKASRHKVAIDARRLVGNLRGVGFQVYNLACLMPKLAPNIEFLLLTDRPMPETRVPSGCRQVVVGSWRLSGQSQSISKLNAQCYSVYWMNVLVPLALQRERVDLFHGTNIAIPLVWGGLRIATIHDLVSVRAPGALARHHAYYNRTLVGAVLRRATHIVAVSKSTKRDIVELYHARASGITTIYPGVDANLAPVKDAEELEQVRRRLKLPSRFVVVVGAVERQKRLETLLEAAVEVLSEGFVDGVVLAGEQGRGAGDVRQTAVKLGIADRVLFLGYVAQEVLPAIYSLAQCSVYPSWYEGFGVPVLEAMACGTPVITSNASSLPEVAGEAALLVPPGDTMAMRRALKRVLTDERLRGDLVRKGIERAKQFEWSRCALRHVEVYHRFLDHRRRVGS